MPLLTWADQVTLYITRIAHSEALIVRGTGYDVDCLSPRAVADREHRPLDDRVGQVHREEPAVGIGLALRNIGPKSRSIGDFHI